MDQGYVQKWFSPEYIPSDWDSLIAPGFIENQGLKGFDGIVWLRKYFHIPSQLIGKNIIVNLEILDNFDRTFLNGIEIDSTSWHGRRIYYVPGDLIREGKNTLVVHLENFSGNGGFESKKTIYLRIHEVVESDKPVIVPLSGKWLYKPTLTVNEYPCPSESFG